MKKIIWLLLLIIFLSLWIKADFSLAQESQINLYFFYGETCSHCKKAEKFLGNLKEKYPELQIKSFEVFGNKENAGLLLKFLEACEEKKQVRVPVIFIGNEVIIRYLSDETTGKTIEAAVFQCLEKGCSDPLEKLGECETCECEGEMCDCQVCECKPRETEMDQIIRLPLIGEIDLSKLSLPTLTVILGALDGLNPCAMWVLAFLIILLINTRSRKRMWLIGGTFILASGIVYFLVLSAWLNLFLAISYVNLTRKLIGILAIGVGIWQIKNFVTYHPGVCKVLGLRSKLEKGLRDRAEKIVTSPFTFGIIVGLIILALGVNLVEFFCSFGLPAFFTQILSLNNLSKFSYYSYLLLYTFIFMLDDLIILLLAIITLSKIGFTEKYNYWSTLIGGLLILALGILLIFKPELLMFG
ncbi:hypothetical protein KJA15_01605 [Patescibacteria group bacterium]|nr:hypothetical protein [Patescibacteria group bacterium]